MHDRGGDFGDTEISDQQRSFKQLKAIDEITIDPASAGFFVGSFARMNQQKYIAYAFLFLLIIAGTYFIIQKVSKTKTVESKAIENLSTQENDSDEKEDSLPSGYRDGKIIFMRSCASCHSMFRDGAGPSMVGLDERWPDKKKLFAFIRNPPAVMARNEYARKLKARYGSAMPPYPNLSDKEIQSMLNYFKHMEKPLAIP